MLGTDEIDKYLNILKSFKENKKDECLHKNTEITVIDQCGKVELCHDCGIIVQKLLNYEGNINDHKRCYYKKKSVYKREYYLKRK